VLYELNLIISKLNIKFEKAFNMDNKKNILVPIDFTEVTEHALEHACNFAKQVGYEIQLLHVVDPAKKELKEINNKLLNISIKYKNKYGVNVVPNCKPGSIFSTISKFCTSIQSKYIFMGTHGVKGIQHIVGAFAVRVILSSKVPVVITQNKSDINHNIDQLLVPVSESEYMRELLLKIIDFALLSNSKVLLLKKISDEEKVQNRIDLNANFIQKHLQLHEIKTEIIAGSKKEFEREIMEVAKERSAQMILTLSTPEKALLDYVLGPAEQKLINNEYKIPVMCINTLQTIYSE
jgi:nucleotide-binding universal stress UspA family protein